MDERAACALLKARFEAAGFQIEENRPFSEAGVQFEIDGYDPTRRVGYEYVSEEAGDSWDVDTTVISKLDAAAITGDVKILIVKDTDAPDPASVVARADAFLARLVATEEAAADEQIADGSSGEIVADRLTDADDAVNDAAYEGVIVAKPAARKPATRKPAAKKPPANKPTANKPAAKKPTAKQPAAKQPTAKQPTAKQPTAKQPAAKKPAAKKPAAKKPAAKKRR